MKQQTGWTEFDNLVHDATRREKLTPADVQELRRRANDLFSEIRTGSDVPRKAEKLQAIRDYKTTLDEALDATIDPAKLTGSGPSSFKQLSEQQGLASTLRETRGTAGEGYFSPKAVAEHMEKVYGPKAASLEKNDVARVMGALERRTPDSFAASPEQYKALIASTLLGSGALFGAMQLENPWPIAAGIAGPALLGSKAGRSIMTGGGAKREAAGRGTHALIRALMSGQADVPGLL
jgi:hypothetical protein